ncbi:hypothetical protein [Streptomyces sp. NPDC059708]|uniref:hypothetical protein n=1 Tax=Streptomyces sp. NPDC059708 TaxID=3346916 RepID=UPI0036C0F3EF
MNQIPAPVNGLAEYERLLTVPALTAWTADRQREHGEDAAVYASLLAVLQSSLRSEAIPGDGRWSAKMRARRVLKPARRLVEAARAQERAAEELRLAFADHVAHVTALPGQRAAKAREKEARKAGRRSVAAAAAKSLNKTAGAATADSPGAAAQAAPVAQVRGINELWRQGA